MAAPLNNQFWKLRSKHGRYKIFATPAILLDAACEYFQWCQNNPWYKAEQLKKPIIHKDKEGNTTSTETIVHIPTQRPFTLSGLCIYLDVNQVYFNHFKEGLKNKEKNVTEEGYNKEEQELIKDFSKVVAHIEEIIYTQKFEGAAVGVFNANIIARDLGLIDRTDITTKDKEIKQIFKIGDTEIEL